MRHARALLLSRYELLIRNDNFNNIAMHFNDTVIKTRSYRFGKNLSMSREE